MHVFPTGWLPLESCCNTSDRVFCQVQTNSSLCITMPQGQLYHRENEEPPFFTIDVSPPISIVTRTRELQICKTQTFSLASRNGEKVERTGHASTVTTKRNRPEARLAMRALGSFVKRECENQEISSSVILFFVVAVVASDVQRKRGFQTSWLLYNSRRRKEREKKKH